MAGERGARLSAKLRKTEIVDRVIALLSADKGSRSSAARIPPGKKNPQRSRGARKAVPKVRPETPAPSRSDPDSPLLSPADLHRISEEIARLFPPPAENSEIVFYEIDPFHAHVFWHVRLDKMEAGRSSLGPEGRHAALVLRFYDVTLIQFDGFNAHAQFDVAVHSLRSNFYVDFWESGRSYIVDIGLRAHDGRFVTLARSNHIELPPHAPSNNFDRTGIVVDSRIQVVCEVADVARAETLADIRTEPRPDMEAETSDQLVRTFYRQLTEQGLPALNQRVKERLAAGPTPTSAPDILPGTSGVPEHSAPPWPPPPERTLGEGAVSRAALEPATEWRDVSITLVQGDLGSHARHAPTGGGTAHGVAGSSASFYEQGQRPVSVSSWAVTTSESSFRVSSPGHDRGGSPMLERVITVSPDAQTGSVGIEDFRAELVIRGRTLPGHPLQFMGEPVAVRPDGTFNIRRRLGEGTMVVPVPQDAPRPDDPPDKAAS